MGDIGEEGVEGGEGLVGGGWDGVTVGERGGVGTGGMTGGESGKARKEMSSTGKEEEDGRG